jgi:hypothetical protein
MSTLFIILIITAIFHFTYEGIILPSLRLKLRYQLFGLRDKLRRLKLSEGDKINAEIYHLIQNGIHTTINLLPFATVSLLSKTIDEIRSNADLREKVRERSALIENCQIDELKSIFSDSKDIMAKAFVINSAPLIIYFIPFSILAVIIIALFDRAKRFVNYLISLTYYPQGEVEKLVGECPACISV